MRPRTPRQAVRRAALLLAVAALASGCLMPSRGTPVFVDHRAGGFWSGKGLLIEVSEDQRRCRVAVRDRALFVRKPWVECTRVHPRSAPPSV
jgi:hypothetical protein